MQCGTQGHVAAPRGPTQRLRGVMRRVFIFTYIVIICIAFRLLEGIINPLNTPRLINPLNSFNFSHVGLSSTRFLNRQVTWPIVERWIKMKHNRGASITWTRGPPIAIKSTCFIKRIITVLIKWRGANFDRPIAIQSDPDGCDIFKGVLKRISNGSSGPSISDPTDEIYLKQSTMDRSIVIVDHFDRTVTPNSPIN